MSENSNGPRKRTRRQDDLYEYSPIGKRQTRNSRRASQSEDVLSPAPPPSRPNKDVTVGQSSKAVSAEDIVSRVHLSMDPSFWQDVEIEVGGEITIPSSEDQKPSVNELQLVELTITANNKNVKEEKGEKSQTKEAVKKKGPTIRGKSKSLPAPPTSIQSPVVANVPSTSIAKQKGSYLRREMRNSLFSWKNLAANHSRSSASTVDLIAPTPRFALVQPPLENTPSQAGCRPSKHFMREISNKLSQMFRLPKAYRWLSFEFFYSDIDRVIFKKNDFQNLLKDAYPKLKTHELRRAEWSRIRRTMGKPRRMSPCFFEEERETLHELRTKIRMLQKRVLPDGYITSELPDEIPLQYVIGTEVVALIKEGLHKGKVTAMDTSNHTYRIEFDRAKYKIRSVEDYCLASEGVVDKMKVSSLALKLIRQKSWLGLEECIAQRRLNSNGGTMGIGIGTGPVSGCTLRGDIGGYPVHFLDLIVKLNRLLHQKSCKIAQLKQLNGEAEVLASYDKRFSRDFRLKYCVVLVELDKTNEKIESLMEEIKTYIGDMTKSKNGLTFQGMIDTKKVLDESNDEAASIVSYLLTNEENRLGRLSQHKNIVALIWKLASILFQYKSIVIPMADAATGVQKRYPSDCLSIHQTLMEIRSRLAPQNVNVFQNVVELPIRRLMAGVSVDSKRVEGPKRLFLRKGTKND